MSQTMLANQYMRQAAKQYQTTQVATADPARLVLMMYDGAIRFARQGIQSIGDGDIEAANRDIGRVQDIVAELAAALNFDTGEIAQNLLQMYDYINRRLVDANVQKDGKPLEECIELLGELRDTWQQLIPGGEGGAVRAENG